MRHADTIIIGAGIIGLSLALELRKHGDSVLVLERHEPGRESSYAAAGMLAPHGGDLPPALQALAVASADAYPQFVAEIEDASGLKVDLRSQGTILVSGEGPPPDARKLSSAELTQLEFCLSTREPAYSLQEHSVDPRALMAAIIAAAKHRGVHIASGADVQEVTPDGAHLIVRTAKTEYSAPSVVNCAGAWSGAIGPLRFPTRPIKGQIFSVIPPKNLSLSHVIRAQDVYLVPRSDGRVVIGATAEEAGFDKRVDPAVIQHMLQAATNLVPQISQARIHDSWAGLRPSTPDDLPILSATHIPGYFIAAGHFRNGILLAPVTAQVMAKMLCSEATEFDLACFSVTRFLRQGPGNAVPHSTPSRALDNS